MTYCSTQRPDVGRCTPAEVESSFRAPKHRSANNASILLWIYFFRNSIDVTAVSKLDITESSRYRVIVHKNVVGLNIYGQVIKIEIRM